MPSYASPCPSQTPHPSSSIPESRSALALIGSLLLRSMAKAKHLPEAGGALEIVLVRVLVDVQLAELPDETLAADKLAAARLVGGGLTEPSPSSGSVAAALQEVPVRAPGLLNVGALRDTVLHSLSGLGPLPELNFHASSSGRLDVERLGRRLASMAGRPAERPFCQQGLNSHQPSALPRLGSPNRAQAKAAGCSSGNHWLSVGRWSDDSCDRSEIHR